MKNSLKIFAAVAIGMAAVACSSASKMVELAENVIVTCDPEVLECVAGNITAEVTVTYPADYFNKKAILEVTPVLVYADGEVEVDPFMYQGEKVKDNYTVISSDGQTVVETVTFPYTKGVEDADFELRGVVSYKSKSLTLPTRKVADGTNTTYMLVCTEGTVSYKADEYQEVIPMSAEGQIMYSINSSTVSNSELKSSSVKDFQAALDEIAENERKTLVGTEVVAYASPDGGQDLNAKLSDKRADTGSKAWTKVVSGKDVSDPSVQSIGQDWEGFQELVSESDIEDKDLILRVLSMYSDPAVRESEIKNMSEVYTSLKKEVLPALRRARFIANVEYQNWTSEELLELVDSNIDVLDEEALLRAASLVEDPEDKIAIYKKAISAYDSERAQYNLGIAYLEAGDVDSAEAALDKVETKDADVENALGVCDLRNGKIVAAGEHFAASGNDDAKANIAVIDILNGKYEAAASALAGTNTINEGLAYILTDQPSKTEGVIECDCPKASYVKAVAAARLGDESKVKSYIEAASEDADLAARYETDIEFAAYK